MILAGLLPALFTLGTQAEPAPEPPRGVNSSVLGPAEEYAQTGPARVCLMHTSIDLETGETAYLDYLGLHHGGFRVTGPRGTFHIREGNAWRVPSGGSPVSDPHGRRVERHLQEGQFRYLMYGRSDDYPDRDAPLVWVDGDVIGGSDDLAILGRIDISQDDRASCDRRYFYGFDGFGQAYRRAAER